MPPQCERIVSEPADLRAVVFDLDGLMFNTEDLYHEVGEELLRRRGEPVRRELFDAMMGQPGNVALQLMIDQHALTDTVEGLACEADEIFVAMFDARLAPMPGLMRLLAALEAASIPKGIATSSDRAMATDVLGRFELVPRFKFLLTAEDVTRGKPHPEIYHTAARQLSLSPAEILVLEDSGNGCRAAVEAGMFAVAVPTHHSREHDFTGSRWVSDGLEDPRIYEALGLAP